MDVNHGLMLAGKWFFWDGMGLVADAIVDVNEWIDGVEAGLVLVRADASDGRQGGTYNGASDW